MNTRALALPAPLASLRQRAQAGWQTLSPRDRRLATLAVVVLGLGLAWLLLVQPALRTLREAPATIDRLDAQLQQMQTLAAESRSLKSVPPVSPTQAGAALKAATSRLGDQARVVVQGERATITLSGVNGETLRSLLAELRSTARARVVEAQFVRGGRGYDGTVVLSLGSAP